MGKDAKTHLKFKKSQRKSKFKDGQNQGVCAQGFVKPTGKFWKRYFNKLVRKGATHKRCNWFYWN